MFSTFKKFFGRRADEVAPSPSQPASVATAPAPRFNGSHPAAARSEIPQRQVTIPAHAPANLTLPLKPILDRLSPDLQQRIRQLPGADVHISISMQKVLSQMPQGAVKLTFGELRLASPPGVFSAEVDRDRNLVDIPLQEILSRLDASLLARRPSQRQVVVPPEVTGPFGGQAKVTFSTNPVKGTPITQPATNGEANGHTNRYAKANSAQPPVAPAAPVAPPTPAPAPVAPRAPISPLAPSPVRMPAPAPVAFKPIQPAQPIAARAPQVPAQPVASPAPSRTMAQFQPPPVPQPAPIAKPAQPQPFIARIVQSATAPAPVAFRAAPQTASAEQPVFNRVSPAPVAPGQPVVSPIAPEPEPEAPIAIPMTELPRLQMPAAPISPITIEPEPEPQPIRFSMPEPEPVPEPVAPVPIEPAAPPETRFISTSVAELSAAWPDSVLQEIKTRKISNAIAALPFGVMELALKQGKIALPWRIVRSWIQVPGQNNGTSPQDATVLELPIKLITPLFLAELRGNKAQKKVSIDQTIPDLFSNRSEAPAPAPIPTPAAPAPRAAVRPAAAPKPADTNYFTKLTPENQPEEAVPPIKQGPTPGTAFLVRYATPNEIVSKAAALDGVDGALIALPDGLLVASRIPPTMNADTIAAFLPQIFGRVSQCTKELRLGELNNLNFTVGNIPWKIFKVGAIYFAAFGRVGEALPSAQLAGIAAELDRKAK